MVIPAQSSVRRRCTCRNILTSVSAAAAAKHIMYLNPPCGSLSHARFSAVCGCPRFSGVCGENKYNCQDFLLPHPYQAPRPGREEADGKATGRCFSEKPPGARLPSGRGSRIRRGRRGDVKRKVAITLKNQGEIKNKRLSHYAESRPGKTGRLFCVVGLERRKIFLVEN